MILLVYGTRPEFIKISPLINEMERQRIKFKTLFTGQHKDIVDGKADWTMSMEEKSNNRLDSIIKGCMNLTDEIFEGITHVLVQGDTTSVVGLALSALHRKIKIIHLEAGLRTHDTENPYPEENNRRIVSAIADIHLCPTWENKINLIKENIPDNKIFVVGNTGLDNLKFNKASIDYKNKVLITLHRRENHDMMDAWFNAINSIARNNKHIEFIMPIHPNPNVQKHRDLLTDVNVVAPLTHDELITLLLQVVLVITDSGGIQEECSYLNKKCLVCRKVTERPESLGTTSFLVDSPDDLALAFFNNVYNPIPPRGTICPYGDGKASEKICKIFKNLP